MDALKVLVQEVFLKTFYGKKKVINFLIAFYVSYKSDITTFLKQCINKFPKDTP